MFLRLTVIATWLIRGEKSSAKCPNSSIVVEQFPQRQHLKSTKRVQNELLFGLRKSAAICMDTCLRTGPYCAWKDKSLIINTFAARSC